VNPSHPTQFTPEVAGILFAYGVFVILLLVLSLAVNWKIAVKAGYPGVASLWMLVPLANFVVLLIFAFTDWPIERELKAARGNTPPPGTWQQPPGAWQPPAQI